MAERNEGNKKRSNRDKVSQQSQQHQPPAKPTPLDTKAIEALEANSLVRVNSKKKDIPVLTNEKWKCLLCAYTCDNYDVASNHITRDRHKINLKERDQKWLLEVVPPPCDLHREALNVFLKAQVSQISLSDEEILRRKTMAQSIVELIQLGFPGVKMEIYGSLYTALSIAESDVNLCVSYEKKGAPMGGQMISQICSFLQSKLSSPADHSESPETDPLVAMNEDNELNRSAFMKDVLRITASFKRNPPYVSVVDVKEVVYRINIRNEYQVESDHLVKTYLDIDERGRNLALLFRKFLRLADVDRPENGGLTSRVAAVMTIFFLQNKPDPILLPNLQRIVERNSHHIPPGAVRHVNKPEGSMSYLKDLTLLNQFFDSTKNQECLAELWLAMLRFYLLDFIKEDYVVSITDFHPVVKYRQVSTSKRLSIQDPIDCKYNLCKSVSPPDNHAFIMQELASGYLYFAIPQIVSTQKALFGFVKRNKPKKEEHSSDGMLIGLTTAQTSQSGYIKPVKKIQKAAFDFVHYSTVSDCNTAVPLDTTKAFRALCMVTLEQLCLHEIKPDLLKDWDLNFQALVQKEDQVARWIRFSTAFCTSTFDAIWKNYFDRDKFVIRWGDFKTIIVNAANASLDEGILTDSTRDCDLLSPTKTLAHALDELKRSVDIEQEDNAIVECHPATKSTSEMESNNDEDDENNDEFVEEVIAEEGLEDDDVDETLEKVLISTTALDIDEKESITVDGVKDVEMYTRSGWEIALNQRCQMVVEDDPRPDWYSAELVASKITTVEDMKFEFNGRMLYHKTGLVPICNSCNKHGHLREDCPQDMPNLDPASRPNLKQFSAERARSMDEMLQIVADNVEPTPAAKKDREDTFERLRQSILTHFPRANLTKFGSSMNGFGTLTSDLDVNLSFDLEDAEYFSSVEKTTNIVTQVERVLRKSEHFVDILAIRHAKVPIVKFRDRRNNIDGDISFSNKLAVENTRLLKVYSTLLPHCHTLGLALKHLVKLCEIGDASRGSLSSYAYILLLIHFMQQRNYLPILQMIHEEPEKPQRMMENFNVWFQEDLDVIRKHWTPPSPPPKLSEIWLGFFDYYLYEFQHREQVATIRQKERLLKLDKLFTNKDFAIEDPFELSHNLGVGLSRKMFCYILNIFQEVLNCHLNSRFLLLKFEQIIDCYFNREALSKGRELPRDRGCKICGKIGHLANDCTTKRSQRNNKELGNTVQMNGLQPSILPIVLQSDSAPPTSAAGSRVVAENVSTKHNLFYLPPRHNDRKFMDSQPLAEIDKDFHVKLVNLSINNQSILIPVLSHANPGVMQSIAIQQTPFAYDITPSELLQMISPITGGGGGAGLHNMAPVQPLITQENLKLKSEMLTQNSVKLFSQTQAPRAIDRVQQLFQQNRGRPQDSPGGGDNNRNFAGPSSEYSSNRPLVPPNFRGNVSGVGPSGLQFSPRSRGPAPMQYYPAYSAGGIPQQGASPRGPMMMPPGNNNQQRIHPTRNVPGNGRNGGGNGNGGGGNPGEGNNTRRR